ncbi:universal stress protein [Kitasatospora herbaricolor]|uniref:universal stress protein n=1 Tax=Kitasatospora herbaricolor TaxID=68217 RepID=UPI00174C6DC5|nr:universal stress protein [Kitasatospora herbaricolor]MDQ0306865.1 nucleotide-binding universal stress UspA family protein [Kitasatospora herbaricolor]GGV19575.1 universal stress protein [Kitasatospora herbaricolor]
MGNGTGGRIVVGVDGSAASRSALRWAVEQARVTGGTVEALCAWEYPAFYGWVGSVPVADGFDPEELATRTLAEAVTEAAGDEPPVKISQLVIPGNAARALLDTAAGAALLVVGSRGLGGFSGALLGSVSRHLTEHAPCPVVVLREGQEHTGGA